MKELSGKVALVTGASRGIGVYIARALAGAGMSLALAARSRAWLEAVRAEVEARGVRAIALPTDVADPAALDALVRQAEAALGGISVLVNNAGLEQGLPYARVDPRVIEQIIAVNLTAPMLLARLLLPGMIERGEGHIVNIASLSGLLGTPYNETYSATKHALLGFSRSLRLTARGEGWPLGVSVVSPGFVAGAGMYEDQKAESGARAPALLGTVPAERVAREVHRAIVEDRAEVIVSSRPVMPLAVGALLLPRAAEWIADASGAIGFFRTVARRRLE